MSKRSKDRKRKPIKQCYGSYAYSNPACLSCEERYSCMAKRYSKKNENLTKEQVDASSFIPVCYGSFIDREKCETCPYEEPCHNMSSSLVSDFFRGGKHMRQTGKYKGRGKWNKKRVY